MYYSCLVVVYLVFIGLDLHFFGLMSVFLFALGSLWLFRVYDSVMELCMPDGEFIILLLISGNQSVVGYFFFLFFIFFKLMTRSWLFNLCVTPLLSFLFLFVFSWLFRVGITICRADHNCLVLAYL